MKARIYTAFSLGVALSVLPFLSGCAQPSGGATTPPLGAADAEATPVAVSTNAPAETAPPPTEPPPATAEVAELNAVVPAPAAAAERKLPPSIQPTPPTAELIKLAQAGVEETVMLNYITNTTSMFVLSSDDIIYLNDLGVAGNIVTAMMQHDQGLKTYWANQVAPPPPVATQAAAPTYVDPPQPEPQPEPQPQPAQVEAAPPPPANVTYFDDSLAPYGTWVEVEGYGRCWQPTVVVVNRGWQPYSDRGRWVYTDSGWYWMSDYSWGATTFHYGRWFSHSRYGWCWWPDTVWAPSWVSWRYSSDYCGWAPLPPAAYYQPGMGFSYYGSSVGVGFGFGLSVSCFNFVSWSHFNDPHPAHHRAPRHETVNIYNRTTIVNNYGTGRNNTVANHGIPADRVRERTRSELRPVSIRHETAGAVSSRHAERLERNGRSLVVQRPNIPASAAGRPLTAPPTPRTDTAREQGRPTPAPVATAPVTAPRVPTGPASLTPVTGRDGQVEIARDRNNRPGPVAQPPTVVPSSVPTTPSSPTAGVLSPANQPPRENRVTPRPQEQRAQNPVRPPASPTPAPAPASPPINRVTVSAPPVRSAPANSTVVIGRRETNPSRNRTAGSEQIASPTRTESPANAPRPPQNWSAQRPPTPAPQSASPPRVPTATAPSYTVPTPPAPRMSPQENRNPTPQPAQPSYAPTRQSPPARVYSSPTPAPTQRNYQSAPSPSFSPRPSPAPSISAPASTPRPAPAAPPAPAMSAPRPAPVEARPAPSPSSTTRTESNGRARP